MRRWAVLLTVLGALLGSPVRADNTQPPYDIQQVRAEVERKFAPQMQELERAVREGRITQAEGTRRMEALNERCFAEARSRGAAYQTHFDEVIAEAKRIRNARARAYTARTGRWDPGWQGAGNTGTPLSDPTSRGIYGDQDLTFRSDADRAAFVEAARRKGYNVKGRLGDGYVMIDQLDIAAHGPTEMPARPLDPQARLQTSQHVHGHETFATPGARQAWIPLERNPWTERDMLGTVADNIKKVEHDLRRNPADLDDWFKVKSWAQNLAKGTGRAMDASGKTVAQLESAIAAARQAGQPPEMIAALQADLTFRQQLATLKSRMDPKAAGIVPVGATHEETVRLLQQFQERALAQFHQAYRQGVANNTALIAEIDLKIAQFRRAGQMGSADDLALIRARIIDADAQAIQYLATNPGDKGRLLAEIVTGGKLTRVETPGGIRYRTVAGQLLTEDDAVNLARKAMAEARSALRTDAPEAPRTGPQGMSNLERGALYVSAVLSGLEGARQELEAAQREGRDPSKVMATLRGWWEFTGIPGAYHIGVNTSRDQLHKELDRIQEMIDRGEQPSAIWSAIRHVTITMTRVAGAITGISNIVEAGDEFIGLLEAAQTELGGPPGDVDALVRARSGKLLALIERDIGEFARKKDRIVELTRDAVEPMDRMKTAAVRLWTLREELSKTTQNILHIQDACRNATTLEQYVRREEVRLPVALERAGRRFDDLESAVNAFCASVDGALGSGGSLTSEATARLERERATALQAYSEWDSAARDAEQVASDIDSGAKELDEELAKLRKLRESTDPSAIIALAPTILEEVRAAGREAAALLEVAIRLQSDVEIGERLLRHRLSLLRHANAETGRTEAAASRLDSLLDAIGSAAPLALGERVNKTVSDAYADFEKTGLTDLDEQQRKWNEACGHAHSPYDALAIARTLRELAETRRRAEELRSRLDRAWDRLSATVRPLSLYVSSDYAGADAITTVLLGQTCYVQTHFEAARLPDAATATVRTSVTLPDGRVITPSVTSVRLFAGSTENQTAADLVLPSDTPAGTCRIEGSIELRGRSTSSGRTSIEVTVVDVRIGEIVVSASESGAVPARRFAGGDRVFAAAEVVLGRSGPTAQVDGEWSITYPDGTTKDLRPSVVEFPGGSPIGTRRALDARLRTSPGTPLGTYTLHLAAKVGDRVIARRSASFDLLPMFENLTLLITDLAENPSPMSSFRPGDPISFCNDVTVNSSSPDRRTRLSVRVTGPDDRIRVLDGDTEHATVPGRNRLVSRGLVPALINEGTYSVTVTLEAGEGTQVIAYGSFRIQYPIRILGIWARDGGDPPSNKSQYAPRDPFEWFMKFHTQDVRPGDQVYSILECRFGGVVVGNLSSTELGPQAVQNDTEYWARWPGELPQNAQEGSYQLRANVRVNGVLYYLDGAGFRIGATPDIVITSPSNGFVVNDKVMVVTGTCADRSLTQATMITNGQSVPIKLEDGRFSAKTVLRPGRNVIDVVAENRSGRGRAQVQGQANIRAAALKVVLSWEAGKTDIDLWVTDPEGTTTNYQRPTPAEGRKLDVDDTSGPGMETYTIETPLRGTYQIAVHYYSAHGHTGSVPFRIQVTRWEATPQEYQSAGSGVLTKAAGNANEPGAVQTFTIQL